MLESYLQQVLATFEALEDERLAEEIAAIKAAIETGELERAAEVLVPQVYAKDRIIVLQDIMDLLQRELPETEFVKLRDMIAQGLYRAVAYEIDGLINRGLWHPGEADKRTMRAFWDYYAG